MSDATSGPVLVTGASGFVGRAVVERLAGQGTPVRAAVRNLDTPFPPGVSVARAPDLDASADWSDALDGAAAVVHCAARVHRQRDGADPLAACRRVNRDGSAALARQAARLGVRRFVFLSSIGVHGAETFGAPFRATDAPQPHSPYSISKHEAETELGRIAVETGLEVVAIRPPLVYGPGAPGNFATLVRAVDRGLPLPLGAIHNQRSLVAIDNLVDLIAVVLGHPDAPGQTFLVSDGEDLSTTGLIRRLARALDRPARLVPVPANVVRRLLASVGRAELAQRLCGSLAVDMQATCERLRWHPPVGVDAALVSAARHLRAAGQNRRPTE